MIATLRYCALLTLSITLAPWRTAHAQIGFGGEPIAAQAATLGWKEPPVLERPALDRALLLAEDELRASDGDKRLRFGVNHAVDISTANNGIWNELPNGDRVWRMSVLLHEAYSVNFEFNSYIVPEGGRVFVYTPNGDRLGAFTAASNPGRTELGVGLLPGEHITIEYHEPAAVAGQGFLRIGQVTQGYRDSFKRNKAFNDGLSCNINVECPEGDPWRDQIRSVARIVVNGNDWCTGQLINNCSNDGTPYFLTANHCLAGSNVSNWVFAFNWESPDCATNTNIPMDQLVSGSTLLVNNAGTDMALLQLNTTPPAEYNVHYTGWDANNTPPARQVGIHHPAGDMKKISLNAQPATEILRSGAQCWFVDAWDEGTTEGGSSGSGLWNPDGRLVGQLFGGTRGCNCDDWYGRFDLSLPLLTPYLGDCGLVLDGYDPNPDTPIVDASVRSIENVQARSCNTAEIQPSVSFRNMGSAPLTSLTLNWQTTSGASGSQQWSGSLASGRTAHLEIGPIPTTAGEHTLTVTSSAPNGSTDEDPSNDSRSAVFEIVTPGYLAELALTLDRYGSETSWSVNPQGSFTRILSGRGYPDQANGRVITEALCLEAGCYTLWINDSGRDGMCCNYGNGSYTLEHDGERLATGDGRFTASISHDFCVGTVSVESLNAQHMLLWPNPGQGRFHLDLSSFANGQVMLDVLDATGRSVHSEMSVYAGAPIELELGSLSEGIYLLRATANGRTRTQRLIINR